MIKLSKFVKYLGVTFDEWDTFGPHVQRVVEKAERRATALGKLMPNIGGPRDKKRLVLARVVTNTVLYAAPVWAGVLRIKRHNEKLIRVQRTVLLRVASAYRTASAAAVQVIVGEVPMDLQIIERAEIHSRARNMDIEAVKRDARQNSLIKWQQRWEQADGTALHTKKMIPRIKDWVECVHRETDYYVTQVLTGHGSFGTYLLRIGKAENSNCRYCGEEDSVSHTVFDCIRWQTKRTQVELTIGVKLSYNNFEDVLIESETNFKCVKEFLRTVMSAKEKDERKEQEEDRDG